MTLGRTGIVSTAPAPKGYESPSVVLEHSKNDERGTKTGQKFENKDKKKEV